MLFIFVTATNQPEESHEAEGANPTKTGEAGVSVSETYHLKTVR